MCLWWPLSELRKRGNTFLLHSVRIAERASPVSPLLAYQRARYPSASLPPIAINKTVGGEAAIRLHSLSAPPNSFERGRMEEARGEWVKGDTSCFIVFRRQTFEIAQKLF